MTRASEVSPFDEDEDIAEDETRLEAERDAELSPAECMLSEIEIEPILEPLPHAVRKFLKEGDRIIDAFFERRRRDRRLGFFPSDYPLVYGILQALIEQNSEARRFCEWGSGFGVVAGLAAFLGYESYGIEIDPRLIEPSRRLLEKHQLSVEILEGSFLPNDYVRNEELTNGDTVTKMTGSDVYDDIDFDIEDFDVIFAFPWPDEEEMYCDLFARYADDQSVLFTYNAIEEIRAYRKRGAPIRNA